MSGKGCPAAVELELNETGFTASWRNFELRSKVIDGTFPDYARVAPQNNDKVATVPMAQLCKAIATVCVMGSTGVKLAFGKNRVVLSCSSVENGKAEIEVACKYEGEPIEIGFKGEYLAEMAARAAPDKTDVTISMVDAGDAALISGSVSGWIGVLMPMRL